MTSAILFLAVFAGYLRLMCPGLGLEDAGEFATAAVTLSLTHPPGYPVYVLAGKLLSLLPAGSPGFRIACGSAACLGLSAVFIYHCAREAFGCGRIAAAGLGLAVAWAPAAAVQGVIPDKYPLNLAFLCALGWVCWRTWLRGGRGLESAAFLGGLSLAHHMMTLYLAPAVLGLCWKERIWHRPRRMILLVLVALLGLSLKPVALTLVSNATPSLMYAKLNSAKWLDRYLRAKEYSGRFAAYTMGRKIARVFSVSVPELWRQAGWPLVVLGAIGVVGMWRRSRPPVLAGVAGSAIAVWLVASFDMAGAGYYLLPVVAFIALPAAAALSPGDSGAGSRPRAAIAAALGVVVALHAGLRSLPAADLSRYWGALDWGRDLLASTPNGGVLVSQHDDDFYPVMYAQRVLHEREDVVLVHRPFLTRLWHHAQVEALHPGFIVLDPKIIPWGTTVEPDALINIFLRSHFGRQPICFSYLANAECAGGFKLLPRGCVFQVGRAGAEPPLPRVAAFARELRRLEWRSAFGRYPSGSRFAEVAGAPAASWTQLSARWFDAGNRAESKAALLQALRYPYTRVVPADLDKLKSTLGEGHI